MRAKCSPIAVPSLQLPHMTSSCLPLHTRRTRPLLDATQAQTIIKLPSVDKLQDAAVRPRPCL